MQKLALLVYPEFSLQEVMNLSRLFRWDYDILTEVISTGKEPVKSEEEAVEETRAMFDEIYAD
ncbi:MAG: hypothetical protein NC434_01010 [Ruminococcus sp.]|nr:hypothetical protein [Ruminococcus sp.]